MLALLVSLSSNISLREWMDEGVKEERGMSRRVVRVKTKGF